MQMMKMCPKGHLYVEERGDCPYCQKREVAGWLIALTGESVGDDYRLFSGRNYLGNGADMDIPLGCEAEQKAYAVVAYEERGRNFYIAPGEEETAVQVNEKRITAAMRLEAYDVIGIGVSRFIFVPFCGSEFDWKCR